MGKITDMDGIICFVNDIFNLSTIILIYTFVSFLLISLLVIIIKNVLHWGIWNSRYRIYKRKGTNKEVVELLSDGWILCSSDRLPMPDSKVLVLTDNGSIRKDDFKIVESDWEPSFLRYNVLAWQPLR